MSVELSVEMSVDRRPWRRLVAASIFISLVGPQLAHAREWADVVTTPFVDPLLANPPQLASTEGTFGDEHDRACSNAPYDRAQPLTLSGAVELALCHSPKVHGAWAVIKAQAAQVGEARAAYLPTISAGMSRLRQKTQSPESQFQINSERNSESRFATLTWRLLDFGGRAANRRAADASLEAALFSHDAAIQKTLASVVGAYFDLQTARSNREVRQTYESLASQTLNTVQKREALGASALSDTLQAKAALAKAELESARALGAHERAMAVLILALGLPVEPFAQPQFEPQFELATDVVDADASLLQDRTSWLSLAHDRHPALLAARAQLDAARERLTAARSEALPALDFTQSRYINGRPNQGPSTSQTAESVVALTLSIPLFDGFGRTYKVRGIQAQIEAQEAALRDTEIQILDEVTRAYADSVAALRNLHSSRRLAEAAQDSLSDVRRRFDKGIADVVDMLGVQATFADAGHERVRALADWRSARLRLLATTGMLGLKDVISQQ
ncbi:cyclolysin secretion protein CyaE [soil metagenome]